MSQPKKAFKPLGIAVLTISDSRSGASDTTGNYLVEVSSGAGHQVQWQQVIPHNKYRIRDVLSGLIVRPDIAVVLVNGGTGFAEDNQTIAAIKPLLDTEINGFGEIFRQLSFADIGAASMQSQALAGLANRTLIFAMPGSGGAAKLAWERLIEPQIDARQGPCNFTPHLTDVTCNHAASERSCTD
ncbi:molybdenum cofactor synthesis domain-containing protein [Aliidiomarina indica]|uniref:molybdenum cofactor synthesis domain-containing protein n=1 Tax=Aliidiomarina indica TaxID=2749147 RepID=UPI001890B0E5|nr:molybdenum cofactor synthesis domain-containing protein [Aliidiomarina indica]